MNFAQFTEKCKAMKINIFIVWKLYFHHKR